MMHVSEERQLAVAMQIWDQLKQPGYLRSLLAMLGGAVFGVVTMFLLHLFQPHHSVMDRGQPPSSSPPALLIVWRMEKVFLTAGSLPYITLIFLYLGWRAIRLCNEEEGWKVALFTGFILIFLLSKIIKSM